MVYRVIETIRAGQGAIFRKTMTIGDALIFLLYEGDYNTMKRDNVEIPPPETHSLSPRKPGTLFHTDGTPAGRVGIEGVTHALHTLSAAQSFVDKTNPYRTCKSVSITTILFTYFISSQHPLPTTTAPCTDQRTKIHLLLYSQLVRGLSEICLFRIPFSSKS